MAGTLLQSSPRGGNHGHHLAIERREGEDCWTIECAGYCYHSSERIRSPRRITRTSQDERIGTSQDFCCTEARWAKTKGHKVVPIKAGKRRISAAGLANIRAATKARWARWRTAKK